jgi:hypothetical protein
MGKHEGHRNRITQPVRLRPEIYCSIPYFLRFVRKNYLELDLRSGRRARLRVSGSLLLFDFHVCTRLGSRGLFMHITTIHCKYL